MSFFGNTSYFLSDTFNEFSFQNSGTNTLTGPANYNNISLFPSSEQDTLSLISGNKWISFQGEQNNTIKIFHNLSSVNKTDVEIGLLQPANTINNPINLAQGDIITGATFKYDAAGHITTLTPVYYKLPMSASDRDYSDLITSVNNINTLNGTLNNTTHPYNIIEAVSTLKTQVLDSQLNNRVTKIENLTPYTNIDTATEFQKEWKNIMELQIQVPDASEVPNPNPSSLLYQLRTLQASVNVILQIIGQN